MDDAEPGGISDSPHRTGPSAARVADAAYFLWLKRDGGAGDAEQDWYPAEKRLLGLI